MDKTDQHNRILLVEEVVAYRSAMFCHTTSSDALIDGVKLLWYANAEKSLQPSYRCLSECWQLSKESDERYERYSGDSDDDVPQD